MQSHQKRGIQKSRTGIKRARESYRDRWEGRGEQNRIVNGNQSPFRVVICISYQRLRWAVEKLDQSDALGREEREELEFDEAEIKTGMEEFPLRSSRKAGYKENAYMKAPDCGTSARKKKNCWHAWMPFIPGPKFSIHSKATDWGAKWSCSCFISVTGSQQMEWSPACCIFNFAFVSCELMVDTKKEQERVTDRQGASPLLRCLFCNSTTTWGLISSFPALLSLCDLESWRYGRWRKGKNKNKNKESQGGMWAHMMKEEGKEEWRKRKAKNKKKRRRERELTRLCLCLCMTISISRWRRRRQSRGQKKFVVFLLI